MMKLELLSENWNFTKLVVATMILTASQYLKFPDGIRDDINECDFFLHCIMKYVNIWKIYITL